MRVLLTGGTGFIGANLVRHLLARGDDVRCLVRKARMALDGLDVKLVQLPMVDQPDAIDDLARAMDGCEGVYHVAGIFDPGPGGLQRMRDVHIFGTRALLRAMEKAGVPRMVLCSSSVTVGFGSKEAPGDEDSPMNPSAIYGTSGALRAYYDTKLQSEQMAASWPGVEAVIVNPDFILGAWDVKPTSGQSIVTMARRGVPVYPKGGKCFQDADDCAIGHIQAMLQGRPGRRYLLGNENLSYQEFLTIVAEVVGKKPPRFPVPDLAILAAGQVGKWGARIDAHRFAGLDPYVLRSMQQARYRSGQRAVEELGIPQTPIVTAVEKAYKWFREHEYC
jgi:dihydroflavonol-4-reductase